MKSTPRQSQDKASRQSHSTVKTRCVNIDFQGLADVSDDEIDVTRCNICSKVKGDSWYGCDFCARWYHRQCLTSTEQLDADMSCIVPDVKFKCAICKKKSMRICGCCFVNDLKNENWIECILCKTSFHRKCVPISFLSHEEFYCYKCNHEV